MPSSTVLEVKDIYSLTTSILQQATGNTGVAVTNDSDLVAVGERALITGFEPILNAIGQVLGKTIFSTRNYERSFGSLQRDGMPYGNYWRKISYGDTGFEESQDWNVSGLADGQSVDMYKIKKAKPVQASFYGSKVLQKHQTIFREQLRIAFRNAGEMGQFLTGVMVNFNNEIEQALENLSRATVANFIAGKINVQTSIADDKGVVHMLTEFNAIDSTEYTAEQVMNKPDVMEKFVKFMVARVKEVMGFMKERTALYHQKFGDTTIMRHTPFSAQRLYFYNPMQIRAEANVFPTVFNTEYLKIGKFEQVNFWQGIKSPMEINVTPNQIDEEGNAVVGDTVNAKNVLGVLFDRDAMGVNPCFEWAGTSPFNQAGGYYNLFIHWRNQWWNDFTENGVVFLLD